MVHVASFCLATLRRGRTAEPGERNAMIGRDSPIHHIGNNKYLMSTMAYSSNGSRPYVCACQYCWPQMNRPRIHHFLGTISKANNCSLGSAAKVCTKPKINSDKIFKSSQINRLRYSIHKHFAVAECTLGSSPHQTMARTEKQNTTSSKASTSNSTHTQEYYLEEIQ